MWSEMLLLYRRAGRVLPWLLFFTAVLALIGTPASAAVELIYFQASTEPDRVFLEWETATELDNAGFIMRRNQSGGSDPATYSQIPIIDATTGASMSVIPARGGSVLGAYYPFYDETVTVGDRYYYLLQDVDTSNVSNYNGPVEVIVGQTFTPTPSPTNTPPPSNTPTPTNTSPVTNTPTQTGVPPTATSQSAANATATAISAGTQPTRTPSPSASPTIDPNTTPVNATLTAIALAVTELASETAEPTSTAAEISQAASPTLAGQAPTAASGATTPAAAATASTAPDEPGDILLDRLLLVGVIFIASGLLLTAGIVYLARRSLGGGS